MDKWIDAIQIFYNAHPKDFFIICQLFVMLNLALMYIRQAIRKMRKLDD